LGPDSIVYSFGVGDNIAWELTLIEKYGLTVHAFDPTPACVAWIGQQRLPGKFHFHPVGIAAHDGFCAFHLPRRGSRFNYVPARPDASNVPAVEMPVKRLTTLMAELGHCKLDVLKMDIEGGEYEVLDDVLAAGISAKQILVEFHHHFRSIGLGATVRTILRLNRAGYRIFHISERGLEFSFLKTA
jgi:FkbM family methyltransferase